MRGKGAPEGLARRCAAVHLDAVGGAAGDMFVAALLDCFPELQERVFADVASVLPQNAGGPVLEEGLSSGLRVRRFEFHSVGPGDHHHHADYPGLRACIEGAALAEGTAVQALAILGILAEAEARMHAVPVEEVHFHEIGDWDSLMDVVAAGSIAAALAPCRWTVSSLPRGSGLVETAHGRLPVPAPATLEILRGFEWRDDGVPGERVTPTGAAILRHLCGPPSPPEAFSLRLISVGTGAGTRELTAMPNILRATAFEQVQGAKHEEIVVLGFDVDDMSGEELAVAADRLRTAEGVFDLVLLPGTGKKGRPLCRFELLIAPAALDAVAE